MMEKGIISNIRDGQGRTDWTAIKSFPYVLLHMVNPITLISITSESSYG